MRWPFKRRKKVVRVISREHLDKPPIPAAVGLADALSNLLAVSAPLDNLTDDLQWSIDCIECGPQEDFSPLSDVLSDAYWFGKTIQRRQHYKALNADHVKRYGKEIPKWDEPSEMTEATERSLALFSKLLGEPFE